MEPAMGKLIPFFQMGGIKQIKKLKKPIDLLGHYAIIINV